MCPWAGQENSLDLWFFICKMRVNNGFPVSTMDINWEKLVKACLPGLNVVISTAYMFYFFSNFDNIGIDFIGLNCTINSIPNTIWYLKWFWRNWRATQSMQKQWEIQLLSKGNHNKWDLYLYIFLLVGTPLSTWCRVARAQKKVTTVLAKWIEGGKVLTLTHRDVSY